MNEPITAEIGEVRLIKDYHQLKETPPEQMTPDEAERFLRADTIPESVRSALEVKAASLMTEVMRIEKKRDEILDYLNGFWNTDGRPFDVTVVTRCKDCKWYRESAKLYPERFCYHWMDDNGNRIGYNTSDEDFCSKAEPRRGES